MATTFFSPSQLKSIVDKTLTDIPEGHTNAIVGTIDSQGAQIVVAFKTQDEHWVATGTVKHDWSGDNIAAANVIYSW